MEKVVPESEGSNVDTNTGESETVSSSPSSEYDKWYAVGQKTEAAKDQGKSY